MVSAQIKKGKGIDGLVSGHTPQQLEEYKKICTENVKLRETFAAYKEAFCWYDHLDEASCGDIEYVTDNLDLVVALSKPELNAFIYGTMGYEDNRNYGAVTGMFFTRLIQASYLAGNNDFEFDLNFLNSSLYRLGRGLSGKKDPLRVSFSGTGYNFNGLADYLKNVHLTLKGEVPVHGHDSENSIITTHGSCYFSENIVADHCIFRSDNEEVLEEIDSGVGTNNRIVLLNPDSSETIVRDYDYKKPY